LFEIDDDLKFHDARNTASEVACVHLYTPVNGFEQRVWCGGLQIKSTNRFRALCAQIISKRSLYGTKLSSNTLRFPFHRDPRLLAQIMTTEAESLLLYLDSR
jgi:hypothetical protein